MKTPSSNPFGFNEIHSARKIWKTSKSRTLLFQRAEHWLQLSLMLLNAKTQMTGVQAANHQLRS